MSGGATTKEGVEVQVGQVWRDLDKRMAGRRVKVLAVYPLSGRANVENIETGICTQLAIRRMHKGSTGWALDGIQ